MKSAVSCCLYSMHLHEVKDIRVSCHMYYVACTQSLSGQVISWSVNSCKKTETRSSCQHGLTEAS